MSRIKFTLQSLGIHSPKDTGSNPLGIIHSLSNEERFTATNFSEPLTTYAVGWTDPNDIRATLDAMFPPVEIGRRFEFKSAVNAESFLSETDDIRAIGSPFKRVEYKGSSVNETTLNKGLTIRLDRDEMVLGEEERSVARLLGRLNRNDLRRGVALLIAAATNTAKTWDTSAGKDHDMDVMTDLDTGGDTRGIDGNQVVYGRGAWLKRVLSLRAQDLAGQANSSIKNVTELADFLGVDKVLVSRERYQSTSTAKAKILGNYVIMYFAEQQIGKDDPSDVKQFWTPTDSGRYRVYREEHAKYVDISVEHYSNIVMTANTGVRMFTVS